MTPSHQNTNFTQCIVFLWIKIVEFLPDRLRQTGLCSSLPAGSLPDGSQGLWFGVEKPVFGMDSNLKALDTPKYTESIFTLPAKVLLMYA
ncbi:MAG: hypothetical protein IPH20_06130 [Bacteroidales bacterium]|nr:hypothetical protein [Bacteroidales bacterium]